MASALRVAFRQFRQHPTFALVTVLVLGLGTGAATTVFTIVDAVVLRPLPYKAPDRLVTMWDTNHEKGLSHDPISPVNFMDYRALPVFQDAAAWWRPGVNLIILIRIAQSALTRVLYEVTPGDVGSTAIASAVLLGAALLASVPPALRAMRVDPVEGLRAE